MTNSKIVKGLFGGWFVKGLSGVVIALSLALTYTGLKVKALGFDVEELETEKVGLQADIVTQSNSLDNYRKAVTTADDAYKESLAECERQTVVMAESLEINKEIALQAEKRSKLLDSVFAEETTEVEGEAAEVEEEIPVSYIPLSEVFVNDDPLTDSTQPVPVIGQPLNASEVNCNEIESDMSSRECNAIKQLLDNAEFFNARGSR